MEYSETHCLECHERRIIDSEQCLNCDAEFDQDKHRD